MKLYKGDVQVGLLIGANCIKVLEATQIIHSEGGSPYVYKTRLGWCIVGPINCITEEIIMSCNGVAVKDVVSSKLASHHFAMENSVKDISLEEMFQAMCWHDFNEPELIGSSTMLKCSEISCEDRKFMEIVEGGTSKKDEDYVVPLPFRDPNLVLPSNRKQAIQRLMGLKRRFVKESKFFQDYLKFMDNLLKNGYARRSDATPSGRTWYIPHHGVYHSSKPGKICVVFDCSAEFQGNCMNKELFSGPDLTNQIIGVLTRFCKEQIAFMANVEAMYYQVQIPEYQQSFLKFLWWENHDIEQEPQDFVMCAHVFGGTSSASCSNYALCRTAVEN